MEKLPTPSVEARRRLADHSVVSLGRYLAEHGDCAPSKGERVAAKTLRYAFAEDDRGDASWTDEALREAGVGAWARPSLLRLSVAPSLAIAERAPSDDGTERLLFRTEDGGLVESVIIPTGEGRGALRTTLCISSQLGCARACTFCETGTLGLTRQLTSGEIVDQYRLLARLCVASDRPVDRRAAAVAPPSTEPKNPKHPKHRRRMAERPVSNIVFMGMGEPMDNLTQVLRAIDLLSEQRTFGFAARRITVSTVGVADRLEEFYRATKAELAISLNAPDDARRSRIMPINQRFDMTALRRALLDAMPPARRVLFQYALFHEFNDSPADADLVAAFVEGIRCRVNVIPANPGPDPTLVAPPPERVDAFVARLRSHGVTTLLRRPRGRDVGGACGQLAGSRRPELVTLSTRGGS